MKASAFLVLLLGTLLVGIDANCIWKEKCRCNSTCWHLLDDFYESKTSRNLEFNKEEAVYAAPTIFDIKPIELTKEYEELYANASVANLGSILKGIIKSMTESEAGMVSICQNVEQVGRGMAKMQADISKLHSKNAQLALDMDDNTVRVMLAIMSRDTGASGRKAFEELVTLSRDPSYEILDEESLAILRKYDFISKEKQLQPRMLEQIQKIVESLEKSTRFVG